MGQSQQNFPVGRSCNKALQILWSQYSWARLWRCNWFSYVHITSICIEVVQLAHFLPWKVGISWESERSTTFYRFYKKLSFLVSKEFTHGIYTIIYCFKEETENVDTVLQECWKTWKRPQIGQLCYFMHVHIILQVLTQQMSSGRVSVKSSVVSSSFLSSIVHTRYSTPLYIIILLYLSTSTP